MNEMRKLMEAVERAQSGTPVTESEMQTYNTDERLDQVLREEPDFEIKIDKAFPFTATLSGSGLNKSIRQLVLSRLGLPPEPKVHDFGVAHAKGVSEGIYVWENDKYRYEYEQDYPYVIERVGAKTKQDLEKVLALLQTYGVHTVQRPV